MTVALAESVAGTPQLSAFGFRKRFDAIGVNLLKQFVQLLLCDHIFGLHAALFFGLSLHLPLLNQPRRPFGGGFARSL